MCGSSSSVDEFRCDQIQFAAVWNWPTTYAHTHTHTSVVAFGFSLANRLPIIIQKQLKYAPGPNIYMRKADTESQSNVNVNRVSIPRRSRSERLCQLKSINWLKWVNARLCVVCSEWALGTGYRVYASCEWWSACDTGQSQKPIHMKLIDYTIWPFRIPCNGHIQCGAVGANNNLYHRWPRWVSNNRKVSQLNRVYWGIDIAYLRLFRARYWIEGPSSC